MRVVALKGGEFFREKFSLSQKIFSLEEKKIPEKSIYVISAKVVSVAEGSFSREKDFTKLVHREGQVLNSQEPFLTLRENVLLPNSGVDRSNVTRGFSILPRDVSRSARRIWKNLKKLSHVANLGIIISDSVIFPMRRGVQSIALAAYGFKAVEDLRDKKDLAGRPLKHTWRNTADMLCNAAALEMGEAGEKKPFVRITETEVDFNFAEKDLRLDSETKDCLFSEFLGNVASVNKAV